MLFNSVQFLIFFIVVISAYYLIQFKHRWLLLLSASYFFYASWNPAYLLLIFLSTTIDYYAAIGMDNAGDRKVERRAFLILSLSVNLGLLFFFKYYNFFNESLTDFLSYLNIAYEMPQSNLLLPVGISFYTFQTLGYSIDVYQKRVKPERHWGIFALYVSFFPQLVAGPIERSQHLLAQFWHEHEYDYARITAGLRLMLWGFFKKLVIADRVAIVVNHIYSQHESMDGLGLFIATVLFAFQIYCDFSGYSDIAIGTAKVMGYDLMVNFRQPYFAKSLQDFWQRWHISLSTWFRDYLYIPLGGNRVSSIRMYVNLFIVFVVSGLWHGANWTFVAWGAIHGAYLILERLWQSMWRSVLDRYPLLSLPIPRWFILGDLIKVIMTFTVVCIAWVFFRADNLATAFDIIFNIFQYGQNMILGGLDYPAMRKSIAGLGLPLPELLIILASLTYLILFQLLQYSYDQTFWSRFAKAPVIIRWGWYYITLGAILFLGAFNQSSEFIYFQF